MKQNGSKRDQNHDHIKYWDQKWIENRWDKKSREKKDGIKFKISSNVKQNGSKRDQKMD